jgi:phosphopantetheinyl transferase
MNPVIFLLSEGERFIPNKTNKQLSFYARLAVKESSILQNLPLDFPGDFSKYNNEAKDGYYWSLSHKKDIVAGVVSDKRVGIDVENLSPRPRKLFKRICSVEEYAKYRHFFNSKNELLYFYLFYTGKEAVLKAEKVGIAGLRNCQCEELGFSQLGRYGIFKFLNHFWYVHYLHLQKYLCALATLYKPNQIVWKTKIRFKKTNHILNQIFL